MCYELCGPPLNGDPEEDAAYEAWLDEMYPDDEEDETSNTVSEREALGRFDRMLDEIYTNVRYGNLEWGMSEVLKKMDPTAYREEFNNWLDSEGLELE